MVDKAFESYHSEDLEEDLVRKVYGDIMECSVSSLEKFAGCAYAHFLNYGLALKEREKQEIASNDLGNVTHAALESFGQYLKQNGEEFAKVSEERCNLILDEITDKLMNQYGDGLFVEAQGTRYLTRRVKRILSRCVQTLRTQLQHGRFEPVSYEQRFNRLLAGGKTMLVGKIDRIDTCEGNILADSTVLPAGYDAVWMSQFLDCFSLKQITKIIKKVVSAASENT